MIEDEAEHQIISVEEYLKFIGQFESYLGRGELFYRAQRAIFQTVIPSIAHQKYSKANEAAALRQAGITEDDTLFSKIAREQHYGIPTRFLDFTVDPLVALFFAVNQVQRDDSVIFIFIKQSESASSSHVQVLSKIAMWPSNNFSHFVTSLNNISDNPLPDNLIYEYVTQPAFVKRESIDDTGNERITAQSGTFVVCANSVNNSCVDGIVGVETSTDFLTIAIPFEYKSEIRHQLVELGYTPDKMYGESYSKLFSDFEPAAESIEDCAEIIDCQSNPKGYVSKFSAHIALNGLFTADEIKTYACHLADGRPEDRLFLWFARDKKNVSQDRNNLVSTICITKRDFPLAGLEKGVGVDPGDSYIAMNNYNENPNYIMRGQRIPVSENALIIELNVWMSSTTLSVSTNLFDEAKLFLSSDQVEVSDCHDLQVKNRKSSTPITIESTTNCGEFSLTLTHPSTQSQVFLSKSGIQYENINSPEFERDGTISPTAEWRFSFRLTENGIKVTPKP